MEWWFKSPKLMCWVFNLWPPFWFTGIRVEQISSDFCHARVRLKWRPWTRNINGSQFGGSLFAMTDPIYSVLLMGQLGMKRYYVWDSEAKIVFKKAAFGAVWFHAHVSAEQIAKIQEHTANGEKYFPEFVDTIVNAKGETIAEVHRTLYVRLQPKYRPEAAVKK